MFKKLGFETATYPPFCTMSWNFLFFIFEGFPKVFWNKEPLLQSLASSPLRKLCVRTEVQYNLYLYYGVQNELGCQNIQWFYSQDVDDEDDLPYAFGLI